MVHAPAVARGCVVGDRDILQGDPAAIAHIDAAALAGGMIAGDQAALHGERDIAAHADATAAIAIVFAVTAGERADAVVNGFADEGQVELGGQPEHAGVLYRLAQMAVDGDAVQIEDDLLGFIELTRSAPDHQTGIPCPGLNQVVVVKIVVPGIDGFVVACVFQRVLQALPLIVAQLGMVFFVSVRNGIDAIARLLAGEMVRKVLKRLANGELARFGTGHADLVRVGQLAFNRDVGGLFVRCFILSRQGNIAGPVAVCDRVVPDLRAAGQLEGAAFDVHAAAADTRMVTADRAAGHGEGAAGDGHRAAPEFGLVVLDAAAHHVEGAAAVYDHRAAAAL